MQNIGHGAPSAPPRHGPPSSGQAGAEAMHFTGEGFLWPSDTTIPHTPHRNESTLRFPLSRPGGQRRLQVHRVGFAALAAVVMAYFLLRCARHLASRSTPTGVLRSLAAAGEEQHVSGEPCVFGSPGEPAGPAVEGGLPGREQVLLEVKRCTSDLVEAMQENRDALLRIPPSFSVKGFATLLRFCVVELAAVCSLLQLKERDSVVSALEHLTDEADFFSHFFKGKRVSRTSLHHIRCMRKLLPDVRKMRFEGFSMPRLELLSKLSRLLKLQQVALKQVQHGMHLLTVAFEQTGEQPPDDAAAEYLDELFQTSDMRRDQVFQDNVLGNWLRGRQCEGLRFGIVAPRMIRAIGQVPPKPDEELLKDLLNTPLGLRQQQISQQRSGPTDVRSDVQPVEPPLSAEVPAIHVSTTSSSPKELSSAEATVGPEESAAEEASSRQASERLDAPATSASSGGLGFSEHVGTSGSAGAGDASQSFAPPTVASGSFSSLAAGVPGVPLVAGPDTVSQALSSPEAPGLVGMPLPLKPPDVPGRLALLGHTVTLDSASQESGSSKMPESATSALPLPRSEAPLTQVSGHHEVRETAPTSAYGGRGEFPLAVGAFKAAEEPSMSQHPQKQLPVGPLGWIGSTFGAPGELGPYSVVWSTDPRWQWPSRQSAVSLNGQSGPKERHYPFKGAAVGEPEGGIREPEGTPPARVAAALFSPTYVDFSKAMLSLQATSGEAVKLSRAQVREKRL